MTVNSFSRARQQTTAMAKGTPGDCTVQPQDQARAREVRSHGSDVTAPLGGVRAARDSAEKAGRTDPVALTSPTYPGVCV